MNCLCELTVREKSRQQLFLRIWGGKNDRDVRLRWEAEARAIVVGCMDRNVPVFVKQVPGAYGRIVNDINSFPLELRYQQYPTN